MEKTLISKIFSRFFYKIFISWNSDGQRRHRELKKIQKVCEKPLTNENDCAIISSVEQSAHGEMAELV